MSGIFYFFYHFECTKNFILNNLKKAGTDTLTKNHSPNCNIWIDIQRKGRS
jgi:hypothetical protein